MNESAGLNAFSLPVSAARIGMEWLNSTAMAVLEQILLNMFYSSKAITKTPRVLAQGIEMSLSGERRGACRECGERDGAERNGMSGECFFKRRSEIERDVAAANCAADLRIDRAQVAMLVMRQRLILRLLGQYMRNAVRYRALLCEQQGEN
jgi:hypothetical protein